MHFTAPIDTIQWHTQLEQELPNLPDPPHPNSEDMPAPWCTRPKAQQGSLCFWNMVSAAVRWYEG